MPFWPLADIFTKVMLKKFDLNTINAFRILNEWHVQRWKYCSTYYWCRLNPGLLHVIFISQNMIERIENLEHLKNLQFLTLSYNKLKKIEGLSTLIKLVFLDLSYNYIKHLDTGIYSLETVSRKMVKCINHFMLKTKYIRYETVL